MHLVGILNLTPDSFSDGGRFVDPGRAIEHAEQLFADGAALVDVGAESTRPGASPLTPADEWARLGVVLPVLLDRFPRRISLDTRHAGTVRRALEHGPVIVNDVTGLLDPAMFDVVVESASAVVVGHAPHRDIQRFHRRPPTTGVGEVRDQLLATAGRLVAAGLDRSKIVLDPGIGFGKTPEVNAELLRFAALVPDHAVMIGHSRKRFLGDDRFDPAPNVAAARIALDSGARYLRVHDVAAHRTLLAACGERDLS